MIELVLVIVILGILAAFAIPRFVDLAGDARASTVKALAGSLRSAGSMAKATALTQGLSHNASISMEGVEVAMNNFYPRGTLLGIDKALTGLTGFDVSCGAGTCTYTSPGAATPGGCNVMYSAPTVLDTAPVITPVITGC